MKTLFMCVNYPKFNSAIGISKKIKSQIETFQSLGYVVTYSAYLEDGVAIYDNGDKLLYEHHYNSGRLNTILRRFYLMKMCINYLNEQSFDLGFIRWDAVDWQFLKLLFLLHRNCKKVLMDFHGYFPGYNSPGMRGKYIKYTTKLFGNEMAKYVDLGLTETRNNSLFGIPTLPMDTGINVDEYSAHKYLGKPNEIHMISVANETVYHGYDRVINGLEQFYTTNPKACVYLHLVGKMSKATVELVRKSHLQDRIILYGYQSGNDLIEIYNSCNIGIGPLAPHRAGGKEGTGIKTKEYFAIGLPYFYAGQELLVPDGYPYVLKIDASDDPIQVESIIAFYNKIKNDNKMNENMRSFARENFSWKKIFSKALQIMGV